MIMLSNFVAWLQRACY